MQKLILLAALLFAISFTACNKEPIDKSASINVPNPTNGNTNNPNQGSSWNWTGTEPFSVKIDGVDFNTDASSVSVQEVGWSIDIAVSNVAGDIDLELTILENSEINKEYTMPSPCNISYTNHTDNIIMMARYGVVKILNITATEIEGKFEIELFGQAGGAHQKLMTEGYFKVAR